RKSEIEVERMLGRLAAKNTPAGSVPFFVGCGAYRHHIPASVDHLIQRSEFLTSYTPYQPEIAQGTLHYLFEFQTQVAMLTGMEVANASMYDGSTATAEAVLMAHRVTRRKAAVIAGNLHPHYRETVETVSRMSEHTIVQLPPRPDGVEDILGAIDKETSCVVVQTPDVYGHLHDLRPIAEKAHAAGALLIAVVTEVVSLGLVTSPGQMGADIVVAEGQSIGNPLAFGGPYVGLFATRQKYVRQMPGRLVGETVDAEGRRGFVLTLSTREQHIRREKATSNICTNSGLCVLAFTIHLSLLGEAGLRRLARINHANAVKLADMLGAIKGVQVLNKAYFNEFTIRVPDDASNVIHKLTRKGIQGGVPMARLEPERGELRDLIVVAGTEVNTDEDRAAYVAALKEVLA
ncbi:MAG: glycine dehydrogenase subunit 1, partial [Hyphomicrobiales bacterium]|nr:glycine dehydrogenase subunit 1 [Hyphomicrobiales bacterium]